MSYILLKTFLLGYQPFQNTLFCTIQAIVASEVASERTHKKIVKCRWFFIELTKQFAEEQSFRVCRYLWVLAKSMSKKARWMGCNYNKRMDGFICMVYFNHPVNVTIFEDLIRDTWEHTTVRPIQRTDGPYTMPKMVIQLLRNRKYFQERGCNSGVPYFTNLGADNLDDKEKDTEKDIEKDTEKDIEVASEDESETDNLTF